MNFFFDYIYYRIAHHMFNKDGKLAATAVILVSLMQTFLIALLAEPILKYFMTMHEIALQTKKIGALAGVIYTVLVIFNFIKYNEKYEKYKQHWENESFDKKTIKGILVIISLFLPILIFAIINTH